MNLVQLFVIFGWPRRTKDYGPSHPEYCPHCDNESWLTLVKERRWFSLFFIPVLPLGRADYWLVCSICGAAAELRKQEFKEFKSCVKATEEFRSGRISENEYGHRLDEHLPSADSEWDATPEEPTVDSNGLEAQFCYQCGSDLPDDATKCPDCGWAGEIDAGVSASKLNN